MGGPLVISANLGSNWRCPVRENRISYNIDLMVEHFTLAHERGEFIVGQDLSKSQHERALRLLASETRFGRRIIGTGFTSIFKEPETHTFWASTVPSVVDKDVRIVFMTYPEPPLGFPIEQMERSCRIHFVNVKPSTSGMFTSDSTNGMLYHCVLTNFNADAVTDVSRRPKNRRPQKHPSSQQDYRDGNHKRDAPVPPSPVRFESLLGGWRWQSEREPPWQPKTNVLAV